MSPRLSIEQKYHKPIISIKEARKILAAEAQGLSDEELLQELYFWEKLAETGLRMAQVR